MIDFYIKVNNDKINIEIIFYFVDEDEEEDDFNQYLKKLSFPAIDYADPKLEDLLSAFGIETVLF